MYGLARPTAQERARDLLDSSQLSAIAN